MNAKQEDIMRIAERAWEWLDRLESANDTDREEFGQWLAASPQHVEEFMLATALHHEFEGVDTARRIDVEPIVKAVRERVIVLKENAAPVSVTKLPGKNALLRSHWRTFAIAAGIASVMIVAAWVVQTYPRWYGYSTDIGEQKVFDLKDGSVIRLNTQSRVKVVYSSSGRNITLVSGEALFQVAKDAARPFRVDAGGVAIQAVGTEFNVYRRAQGTSVSVIEGAVRIAAESRVLAAGQEADITPAGKVVRRTAADTEKASAWRQRRLVFRNDSLAEVAAEFSRYNRTPRILIAPQASDRKITGVFDADSPQLLLKFLRADAELMVEDTEDDVIIRVR